MKQFKKEKDFQSWYGKMLKDKGHIYHKISDMSLGLKPCDMFDISPEGDISFRELKMIDGYTININKFEPQQVSFLEELSRRGCRSLVVVYSKKLSEYKEIYWRDLDLMKNRSVKLFEP